RERMGYDGIVVSDDLEMQAITKRWGPGTAAVLAAKAGCDAFLVCHRADVQVEAIEALVRALESEQIAWTAMDDACGRGRRMKEKYLLPYRDPVPREARAAAGGGRAADLAQQIAERSGIGV